MISKQLNHPKNRQGYAYAYCNINRFNVILQHSDNQFLLKTINSCTIDNQILIGDTIQRQHTTQTGHNQNVFDLKFNSLFLILLPFLFANIRIFISLVLLRIFLSSFSLCTVYQFSLKRLCVDFVVA